MMEGRTRSFSTREPELRRGQETRRPGRPGQSLGLAIRSRLANSSHKLRTCPQDIHYCVTSRAKLETTVCMMPHDRKPVRPSTESFRYSTRKRKMVDTYLACSLSANVLQGTDGQPPIQLRSARVKGRFRTSLSICSNVLL